MDFRFLRAYHTPASRSLHAAHLGHALRHAVAESVTVGHLIKTVRSKHGADPNRFE
jgi:hypothetical protein